MPSEIAPRARAAVRRVLATLATAAAGGALLAGCSGGTVSLQPAAAANDPACAAVSVRLPETVADQPRRDTDAQATAAWGDPASILLRCGIDPIGPTTLPCTTVNGVDWVADDSQAPLYRFISYGRVPTVEVVIDGDASVSSSSALVDLALAVETLPVERACTSATDMELDEEPDAG